jgi:hydroxymethylpyrimidine/phosphomethylpyrimidine kinase
MNVFSNAKIRKISIGKISLSKVFFLQCYFLLIHNCLDSSLFCRDDGENVRMEALEMLKKQLLRKKIYTQCNILEISALLGYNFR